MTIGHPDKKLFKFIKFQYLLKNKLQYYMTVDFICLQNSTILESAMAGAFTPNGKLLCIKKNSKNKNNKHKNAEIF